MLMLFRGGPPIDYTYERNKSFWAWNVGTKSLALDEYLQNCVVGGIEEAELVDLI